MKAAGRNTGLILALAASLLATGWLTAAARAEEKAGASKESASPEGKKSPQSKSARKPSTQSRPTQGAPAPSQQTKKQTTGPKSAGGQKGPLVFTDEDLKKYNSGSSTQPARNVTPAGTPDPLKAIKDEQERTLWRQKRTTELQQKVLDLEARLKALEKRRLSIQNPLLPRTPGPEGTAEQEIGMSGPELLARTDEEIQHTNRLLETARKDLAGFLEKKPE
ncbi:MAG: hypothetical protein L0170_04435 [Acidobacteria bacterium]|nr:hypothetical protein [Acidobacteriota bacterium]